MSPAANFFENVGYLRRRRQMTVAQAASVAGVSVPSWYKYENGEQFPATPRRLDDIAAALGVSVPCLFYNKRELIRRKVV
tara:strand:- start:87 stop:326 length:240 start_codon:yes stop_codon:yes gene_type:complete